VPPVPPNRNVGQRQPIWQPLLLFAFASAPFTPDPADRFVQPFCGQIGILPLCFHQIVISMGEMGFFSSKSALTELLPVASADDPAVDIIFVHGLDGDPLTTWAMERSESWPAWISAKFPRARIWTLRYRLRTSRWFGGAMPLTTRARNVLAILDGELIPCRPIVFICHSYGGLLVKQLLRTGEEMGSEHTSLVERVSGIVFLATPHTGASIAAFVEAIGPIVRASSAISELRRSAAVLQDLNYWFRERADRRKWLLRAYFETLPTYGALVVDESSADLGMFRPIPVDTNHIHICKPDKPDFRVKHTLAMIEQVISAQPSRPTSSRGTPLSQIIAASDEELPYFKVKFEKELERNPHGWTSDRASSP
jgi:pimeloyl-ACP methyl ester carboxylesterase